MEMKLAENIRAFRKRQGLTQEQLAEVLGVTVGAVYKWESKLSQPELKMIMAIADFFDTSVDVLLGYEMKDNRLQATVERLKKYRREKGLAGLAEAEMAMKKHPHNFDIVYTGASLYRVFGIERRDSAMLNRALELLDSARLLLPQNTDPQISDSTISGEVADILLSLGRDEQAVQLLKQNNAGDIYSDLIGMTLATDSSRYAEALPFLTAALLRSISYTVHIIMGYVNVYDADRDYPSMDAVARWGIQLLSGLQEDGTPSFLDKLIGLFHVFTAYAQLKMGDAQAARIALAQALESARRFDSAPNYCAGALRFVENGEQATVYDDLGATGAQSIEKTLLSMDFPELSEMWKELNGHE